MSGLMNALLGGDAYDTEYNFGVNALSHARKRARSFGDGLVSELKSGTQHIADHVRHALCPYQEPPSPLPYGGTGGAEQLIICSQNGTFVQPANYAGFMAWSPTYTPDVDACWFTTTSFTGTTINNGGGSVGSSVLSGSQFSTAQFTSPTTKDEVGNANTGGIKAKWTQAFFRVRCIDNVVNRGGDGFIGQVTQQGGVDSSGIGQTDFNWLMQQKLIKKLLVNGEWNDWHCTTFESDLRYKDTQRPIPDCGVAVQTGDTGNVYDTAFPYFCFLYPNGSQHTWEFEVYFTFQADGNNGNTAGPPVQPNIQNIPHVPEAANINAALAYARSKIPAGPSKHTSIGHHISNFFKSVGHDLEHGLNDAVTGAVAAGAAALLM